jgi:hypothetical protein
MVTGDCHDDYHDIGDDGWTHLQLQELLLQMAGRKPSL